MAPGINAKIFLSILFIACHITVTWEQVPIDCCLQVSPKQIERFDKVVVDYSEQSRGQGCAIDAVILLTRRGKTLCMSAEGDWITSVKEHVNQLKKRCRKNPQDRRCVGVKHQ